MISLRGTHLFLTQAMIEWGEVILDHAQFVQRQLHQPPVHRVEIRARDGITQLLGRCPQSRVSQLRILRPSASRADRAYDGLRRCRR